MSKTKAPPKGKSKTKNKSTACPNITVKFYFSGTAPGDICLQTNIGDKGFTITSVNPFRGDNIRFIALQSDVLIPDPQNTSGYLIPNRTAQLATPVNGQPAGKLVYTDKPMPIIIIQTESSTKHAADNVSAQGKHKPDRKKASEITKGAQKNKKK